MKNYGRKIGLLIADSNNQALDLSGFRVVFTIEKTAAEKPNTAKIDIYNLSQSTASRLISGELTRIVLQAGYAENYAILFDGNLISTKQTRNGAETVLSIEAGDGDKAYSFALLNESVGSGYDSAQLAERALKPMKENGVTSTNTAAIESGTKYPRGRVLFGAARNYARNIARTTECQWSMQDGQAVFCKRNAVLSGREAFLLNVSSGMIGSPTVDKDGISAACCLNPLLKIYDPLKIESDFVNGVYKIVSVKHSGDTHGNEWKTEVKATAIDQSTKKTTQK
jgi:hypothetical protein